MNAAFHTVTGAVAPLLLDDVNTDFIIPIHHCLNTPRERMGDGAFEPARFRADGSENSEFVLNQGPFRGAPILLAGSNFGCGSSREPAVWALQGIGVRVVIARSFGGIFHANCFRNGLLPITLEDGPHRELARWVQCGEPLLATVDLENLMIAVPHGGSLPFALDPARREALLKGLDEIGQTLLSLSDIEAFQRKDRSLRPWVWEPLAAPAVQTGS
jgi:3-isopropylmalate/(R)-2-methylmalate dehydratase small subunit